jgi:hypothetical protein
MLPRTTRQAEGEGGAPVATLGGRGGASDSEGDGSSSGGGSGDEGERGPARAQAVARPDAAHRGMQRRSSGPAAGPAAEDKGAAAKAPAGALSLQQQEELALRLLRGRA